MLLKFNILQFMDSQNCRFSGIRNTFHYHVCCKNILRLHIRCLLGCNVFNTEAGMGKEMDFESNQYVYHQKFPSQEEQCLCLHYCSSSACATVHDGPWPFFFLLLTVYTSLQALLISEIQDMTNNGRILRILLGGRSY